MRYVGLASGDWLTAEKCGVGSCRQECQDHVQQSNLHDHGNRRQATPHVPFPPSRPAHMVELTLSDTFEMEDRISGDKRKISFKEYVYQIHRTKVTENRQPLLRTPLVC